MLPALTASTTRITPSNDIPQDRPLGTAAWHPDPLSVLRHQQLGDLWLGSLPEGIGVSVNDDRHVLLTSGTRGGKGASFIIPNLIQWPGPVVVIDPKGENAMVAARRRGTGSAYCRGWYQKVYILDPFDAVAAPQDSFADLKAAYNPLDAIARGQEDAIDTAARIAEALVVSENANDPFWEDSARDLIKALILHVASSRDILPQERNLLTVRRLLLEGDVQARRLIQMNSEDNKAPSAMKLLFIAMTRNMAFNGVVSRAGAMFLNREEEAPRVMASIAQVAATNTGFMDSPGMGRVLAGPSSFALSDLKTDPRGISVYLSLPQRFMETHARWLRLMTTLIVGEMERVKHQPACGHRVLMVLDEFPALRRMRVIENAAAQIAGFGVKLVMVCQTLAQLKDIYKDNWETLLANAGTKLFFCNDDHFTRDYVSKLVGECEVARTGQSFSETKGTSESASQSVTQGGSTGFSTGNSSSYSYGEQGGSCTIGFSNGMTTGRSWSDTYSRTWGDSQSSTQGLTQSIHKRALVTPDEVGRLFGDRDHPKALLLISGHQPIALTRKSYFNERYLDGFYDPHPDHAPPPTLKILDQKKQEEAQRKAEEQKQREEEQVRQQAEEEARIAKKAARAEQLRLQQENQERQHHRRERRRKILRRLLFWPMIMLVLWLVVLKFGVLIWF